MCRSSCSSSSSSISSSGSNDSNRSSKSGACNKTSIGSANLNVITTQRCSRGPDLRKIVVAFEIVTVSE